MLKFNTFDREISSTLVQAAISQCGRGTKLLNIKPFFPEHCVPITDLLSPTNTPSVLSIPPQCEGIVCWLVLDYH